MEDGRGLVVNLLERERLYQLIESDHGEITPETEELLEENYNNFVAKTDSVVESYQYLEGQIEAAKLRKQQLDDFIEVRQSAIERLKDHVHICMDQKKTTAFRGDFYEIKKRTPSKVAHIDNENLIPPEFIVVQTVTKIDKRKLLTALKNGESIDGASLIDGQRSIQFKTKSLSRKSKEDN